MMASPEFLQWMVTPAIVLTAIWFVVLVWLVARDIKDKSLW